MPNSLRNTEPGINVLIDRLSTAPSEPKWDWTAVGSGQAPVRAVSMISVDDDIDEAEAADIADGLAEAATEEA